MAVRKTVSKKSKKAELGIEIPSVKLKKNTVKAGKKELKKLSFKALALILIFFVIGIGVGVGAWAVVCRNDCFAVCGLEEVELTLDETYCDEGVKIIAFGKDEKDSVQIETNLKTDENGNFYSEEVGTFYIKYFSSCFKYGTLFKVEKIRLVTFVEISEGGQ